jgi:hypothetical protein
MGYSRGQPPLGINGAGPIVGPPESNRSGFGCGGGLGERVGSGVAGSGVAGSGVGDGLAVAEPAAPAQLSTVTVYGRPEKFRMCKAGTRKHAVSTLLSERERWLVLSISNRPVTEKLKSQQDQGKSSHSNSCC